jgi:hypothetical protein
VISIALLLRCRAQDLATAANISGEVLYGDADGSGEVLVSDKFRLVGKPDYIVSFRQAYVQPSST